MTDYIETKAKDGTRILVEVEAVLKTAAGFGGRRETPSNVSSETTSDAYARALEIIRACANGFVETLQGLEATPNAASVDFSIKIDAEAGAMVAKSPAEAQFKVSLNWKKVEPDDDDDDD